MRRPHEQTAEPSESVRLIEEARDGIARELVLRWGVGGDSYDQMTELMRDRWGVEQEEIDAWTQDEARGLTPGSAMTIGIQIGMAAADLLREPR